VFDAAPPLSAWLSLRESVDAAARSHALATSVIARVPPTQKVRALDLGAGAGSNIRYLAPLMPSTQNWLAVDRDAELLALLTAALRHEPQRTVFVDTLPVELGRLDASLFDGRDLITASALLDLVSRKWIEQLAMHCRATGAAVLFALNYDGRATCDPAEPEDALILELFNRHQRTSDKGFGTAAGPDAGALAITVFESQGYEIVRAVSDWHLSPAHAQLQELLIAGWARAASEIAPEHGRAIKDWLRRRLIHVQNRRSVVAVGHIDIGGWLVR
jgi:hypothetical protein